MKNIFTVTGNLIQIEAPGSARKNRIQNDLLWDVNSFLASQYELYTIERCTRNGHLEFERLDRMFIEPVLLSDAEIAYYRGILDPHHKMDDAVFIESCCVENVDMDYAALRNVEQVKCSACSFRNGNTFFRWLVSSAPVYISLFGAKEMRIYVNASGLQEKLEAIVRQYCTPKTSFWARKSR